MQAEATGRTIVPSRAGRATAETKKPRRERRGFEVFKKQSIMPSEQKFSHGWVAARFSIVGQKDAVLPAGRMTGGFFRAESPVSPDRKKRAPGPRVTRNGRKLIWRSRRQGA
jgi:hypothetical protein